MADKNWPDQTICTGDNLVVMRGMNSESVDLIYLDPPFNSNRNYKAPIGSKAAGANFEDIWTLNKVDLDCHEEMRSHDPGLYHMLRGVRRVHSEKMMAYCIYMGPRIKEMRRILKPTGTLYLHCDPTASHYLKMALDSEFGSANFRNEIIWSYRRWPSKTADFQRMHDVILRYSKGDDVTWNQLYEPLSKSTIKRFGTKRGHTTHDADGNATRTELDEESKGPGMRSVWSLPILGGSAKERTGYPTQKPLALLDRIVKASSNPGDVVFDPFCGCATACMSAHMLNRKWIGIDISDSAADLMELRVAEHEDLFLDNFKHLKGGDLPKRTDLGEIPKYNSLRNKARMYREQDGNCNLCSEHFSHHRFLEVDHILARSKGGTDVPENLQLLCSSCNRIKGTGTMDEARRRFQELKEKGLV